jgi:hypothetical protein
MTAHQDDSEYTQHRYRDLRRDDVWKRLFARHPDIPDHEANRVAIYDFAFSLADGTITFANLDEAAKTHPNLNRQDKHFATAENAKQDEETLRTFCRDHRIQFNFAALNMLRNVYGGGFKPIVIDQALQSGKISFVRANDEDVARWDAEDEAKERSEVLGEILGARILTAQDKIKFGSMPLQQLRAEIAQIREERRMRNMTGHELRAYLRQRQQPPASVPELPNYIERADLLELLNSVDSSDANRAIELLDGKSFANGKEAFRYVCDKYGFDAVNQRLGTYVKPQIAGIVREIVHPFDKN